MSGSDCTRRGFMLGSTSGLASLAWPAAADTSSRAKAKRYRFPTPHSDIDTGGAILRIHRRMDHVLKAVQDYRAYRTFLPRLEQSRIVAKKNGHTDMYMRAPILGGVAHVWGVVRYSPPLPWHEQGRKITGNLVKGNLDAWYGVWKMEPCGTDHTTLRMELFADVTLPLPASIVTPELEWACDTGVTAIRDRVEHDQA